MNKRLYNIWSCMKQRCNNPKHTAARWYHDKGIKVCEEWNSFNAFEKWSFENGYKDNLTIDRINSNGDYEPSNCRWVTIEENRRLSRTQKGSRKNNILNANRHGNFMVVRGTGTIGRNPAVVVVKTGLSKSDALKLCEKLRKEELYGGCWFYDRVTDGHKEGDCVRWKELRRCLKV